ncbi:hypothetical protein G9464_11225 [Halostella sp. JP-L12]|uniref:hypothetical protein n=1 Tax=Halostella TaxID=1843185 RepID=UPI000EF7FF54|nr:MULTISPECIES: hypothetical protein [Halostella]NHN48169.1 hypothetical protein [Halostella sp. JP-L12]
MDRSTLERRAWTVGLSLLVGVVVGAAVSADVASFLLVAAVATVVAAPIVSRLLARSIGPDGDRAGRTTIFWATILLSTPLLWAIESVAPDETIGLTLRGIAFAGIFLLATWLAYYGGYDRLRDAAT